MGSEIDLRHLNTKPLVVNSLTLNVSIRDESTRFPKIVISHF